MGKSKDDKCCCKKCPGPRGIQGPTGPGSTSSEEWTLAYFSRAWLPIEIAVTGTTGFTGSQLLNGEAVFSQIGGYLPKTVTFFDLINDGFTGFTGATGFTGFTGAPDYITFTIPEEYRPTINDFQRYVVPVSNGIRPCFGQLAIAPDGSAWFSVGKNELFDPNAPEIGILSTTVTYL